MSTTDERRLAHLLDLGRADEARRQAQMALAANPDNPMLLGYLVRAQLALNHPGATTTARRFVAAAPEREWAHRLLAMALDKAGKPREAVVAAREAVRLAPHESQGHVVLAMQAASVKGLRKEAQRAAEEALRLAPDQAESHFAAGYVAQKRGRRALARREYARTLALKPDHAPALNNLAILQPNSQRAVAGLVSALRADPQQETAQRNLTVQLSRLSYALFVGAVVALFVLSRLNAHHGSPTPATMSVAVAFLLCASLASYLMLRRLPVGTWAALLRRFGVRPQLVVNVLFLIACTTLVVLAGFTPAGHPLASQTAPMFTWVVIGWGVRRVMRRLR